MDADEVEALDFLLWATRYYPKVINEYYREGITKYQNLMGMVKLEYPSVYAHWRLVR